MLTAAQVRRRNWQKARVIGSITYTPDIVTEEEQAIFAELHRLKMQLLDRWDENTEIILGHRLPPYKCWACGKRSYKEYIHASGIVCAKHYKKFTEYE